MSAPPNADAPPLIGDNSAPATGWSEFNAANPDPAAAPASAFSSTPPAILAAAPWLAQILYRDRSHPREFGAGRFGIDRADSRDDTRYAWSRVAPAITAAVFFCAAVFTSAAHAANQYCEPADAVTMNYSFCKPSVDVEGANAWGLKYNTNADMADSLIAALASASSGTFVTINGTSIFNSSVTISQTFTTVSSVTFQNCLLAVGGAELVLNCASANFGVPVNVAGTLAATQLVGGGAGITGIPNTIVSWQVNDFTGQSTGAQTVFTLSQQPANVASILLIQDGLVLSTNDFTYSAPTGIIMSTAPATACTPTNKSNCTSQFRAVYTVNTSTLPAVFILNSIPTQIVTGTTNFQGATSFTGTLAIDSFTATAAGAVGIQNTSPIGMFEVGAGTLTVLASGNVGIGTTTPHGTLDVMGTICLNGAGCLSAFSSVTPSGMISAFYLSSCPSGWIIADGTNSTPDLRGMFVRGAGTNTTYQNANGAYYAATYSAEQGDQMQGHKHTASGLGPAGSPFGFVSGGEQFVNPTGTAITDGTNGTPRVGAETRPANVALTYCMKQ